MNNKVFVSSTIDNLRSERDAARDIISSVGFTPVLAEYDFPSSPMSSREACLAGVEESDVYLGILGPDYGDVPSGSQVSVTEAEWTRAKELDKPTIWFVQDCDRDEQQSAFLRRISDYESGVFRTTFASTPELTNQVAHALTAFRNKLATSERTAAVADAEMRVGMSRLADSRRNASLVLSAIPAHRDVGLDLLALDEDWFDVLVSDQLRAGAPSLFSRYAGYKRSKMPDAIRFCEEPQGGEEGGELIVWPSLLLAAAVGVYDREPDGRHFFRAMIADERVVTSALRQFARAARAIYDKCSSPRTFYLHAAISNSENLHYGIPDGVTSLGGMLRRVGDPCFAVEEPVRVGVEPEIEPACDRMLAHLRRKFETAGLLCEGQAG